MVSKVIALLFISCIALSQAQTACPLNFATTASFCLGNVTCTINTALLNIVCLAFGGLNSVLTITVPNTVTAASSINIASGLSIGGIALDNQASAAINLNFGGAVTLTNNIVATGNTIVNAAAGAVVSVAGRLDLAAQSTLNVVGNLTVTGAARLNGTVQVAATAGLNFASDVTLTAGATAAFAGRVAVAGVAYIDGQATIAANALVTAAKELYFGAQSTLAVAGQLAVTGALQVSGDVEVAATGVITAANTLAVAAQSELSVAGRVSVTGAVTITGELDLSAAAFFNAASDLTIAAQATANVAGNVTAAGVTYVYGKLHLAGQHVQSAVQTAWVVATSTTAKIYIQGSGSAIASLTGNGGIDANVELSGSVTIAPGNSPGAVFIRGDFSMSSTTTLTIEVDSAISYDQLFIGGKFSRDGILHVDISSNYRPSSNSPFTFATHSSEDGDFNIVRGNLDDGTATRIKAVYNPTNTQFQYNSAATVALPLALIALCILGLVF